MSEAEPAHHPLLSAHLATYVHAWVRPSSLCEAGFSSSLGCSTIEQGPLQDCWLLSAVATLSASTTPASYLAPACAKSLALAHKAGKYTFRFFKGGTPVDITVDDTVPVSSDGLPAFARARSADGTPVFWLALLEKAYATLHRGFAALELGMAVDALADLTGGEARLISLSRLLGAPLAARGALAAAHDERYISALKELGARMRAHLAGGGALGCSVDPTRRGAHAEAPAAEKVAQNKSPASPAEADAPAPKRPRRGEFKVRLPGIRDPSTDDDAFLVFGRTKTATEIATACATELGLPDTAIPQLEACVVAQRTAPSRPILGAAGAAGRVKEFLLGHAYAITGVTQDMTILVANPWGGEAQSLSLQEFAETFDALHALTPRQASSRLCTLRPESLLAATEKAPEEVPAASAAVAPRFAVQLSVAGDEDVASHSHGSSGAGSADTTKTEEADAETEMEAKAEVGVHLTLVLRMEELRRLGRRNRFVPCGLDVYDGGTGKCLGQSVLVAARDIHMDLTMTLTHGAAAAVLVIVPRVLNMPPADDADDEEKRRRGEEHTRRLRGFAIDVLRRTSPVVLTNEKAPPRARARALADPKHWTAVRVVATGGEITALASAPSAGEGAEKKEAAEEEAKPTDAVCCDAGHVLVPNAKVDGRSFPDIRMYGACDKCGVRGTTHRCQSCDYDLCEPCMTEAKAASSSAVAQEKAELPAAGA